MRYGRTWAKTCCLAQRTLSECDYPEKSEETADRSVKIMNLVRRTNNNSSFDFNRYRHILYLSILILLPVHSGFCSLSVTLGLLVGWCTRGIHDVAAFRTRR